MWELEIESDDDGIVSRTFRRICLIESLKCAAKIEDEEYETWLRITGKKSDPKYKPCLKKMDISDGFELSFPSVKWRCTSEFLNYTPRHFFPRCSFDERGYLSFNGKTYSIPESIYLSPIAARTSINKSLVGTYRYATSRESKKLRTEFYEAVAIRKENLTIICFNL